MAYYIETTGQALLNPMVSLWDGLVVALPGILAAVVVVLVGYALGVLLGFLVRKLIEKSKLDHQLKKANLSDSLGFISIADLAGGLVKWYVFVIFLTAATELLNLGVLSDLLRKFALWLPNVFIGVVIMVVGLVLADFLADLVMKAKGKMAKLASTAVRVGVVIMFGITALNQVGIDVSFISSVLLLVISGVVLALALAFGIGFGMAVKDDSKDILKWMRKAF